MRRGETFTDWNTYELASFSWFGSSGIIGFVVHFWRFFVTMTDKDTSRARKRTYNKISDVQRSKLQEYYDGGMKTCGSDNTEKIGVAAEETGLTIDQVKVRYFLVGLKHYHVSCMWNTPPLICISLNNNSDHYGECFFLQSTPTYVNDVAVYCPIELIPLLCVLHKRIFLKD